MPPTTSKRPAFDLHPDLGTLRDEAERRLGRPVRMSGSGATLFTLYDDPAEATGAADACRAWASARPALAGRVEPVALCPRCGLGGRGGTMPP